jgi:nucleotide-binding universal stress UspA family protein
MRIVAWLMEGTWEPCVDAAAEFADADITLLYVVDARLAGGVRDMRAGLLGRGSWGRDPADAVGETVAAAGAALLRAAERRLDGRGVHSLIRTGRPEREAVAACAEADLLILARDGDHRRLGPHSLGPHTRFAIDHAPCRVLLIWPDSVPDLSTIPAPPPHPPGHS